MKKIGVFFAEGYEEIEALTVVDICRRAGVEVSMVSVTGQEMVTGGHAISVKMDQLFEEVDFSALDMIILPGGLKGTQGLEAHGGLMAKVDEFFENGKYVAAICAAPSIFGHRGIVKGKKAGCYPGFESHMEGAKMSNDTVSVDGNVITSRGMGTAIDFALAITGILVSEKAASDLSKGIVYQA